jgi:hypothetical protein
MILELTYNLCALGIRRMPGQGPWSFLDCRQGLSCWITEGLPVCELKAVGMIV